MTRTHPYLLAVSLLLVTLASGRVHAVDRFWEEFHGGLFLNASNWFNGVPGPGDSAVFDLGSMYTVVFPALITNDRALVNGGGVTFDLGGGTYILQHPLSSTPSIAVASTNVDTASLTIENGTIIGAFADVGQSDGSFGMLTLEGGNAALDLSAQLRVGNQGGGFLDVLDGAQITNGVVAIGLGQGAFGHAVVDGPKSAWTCNGDLAIGKGGAGGLDITGGAVVQCHDAVIGQQSSAFGDVLVSGPGSALIIAGTLDVGLSGFGSLTIADGGYVSNEVFAVIGAFEDQIPPASDKAVGQVTVDGPDSHWMVEGDLYVDLWADGTLILANGGTVETTGDLDEGKLIIQLGSGGDYSKPALTVGGESDAFLTTIELLNGFIPAADDSFAIISAGHINGDFNFILPNLPANLLWQVIQDDQTVVLQVVNLDADITDDGQVDIEDLFAVLIAWGPCPGPCPPACDADVTGDCQVDVNDLFAVIANWS